MHILMSSITPLLPGTVMGGAQKQLQVAALHLGELGHQVRILCTWRQDTPQSFRWHPNVEVRPVYRFKQPFPGPYETPAYNLAGIIQALGEQLAWADRLYIHDGEVIFPYVYDTVPTVISLRDCVYPETWQGAFLHRPDAMILPSHYTRDYYAHTAGRFFPQIVERIRVIHNGLDWDRFKPTPPGNILDLVPVEPGRDVIVLHPHRPERNKGLQQTIDVADLLVHRYGIANLKVLVPRWLYLENDPALRLFYDDVMGQISARGLAEHFVFHEWIPQAMMPEYLSLGAVTLALGSFVETFGNAVYESLGCGSPTIAARISSHREILPDALLDKVDFNDAERAAALAAEIIGSGRRTSPQTLAYLYEHYGLPRMVQGYAAVILNAQKQPAPRYVHRPLEGAARFRLAPWTYESAAFGLYHDFNETYTPLTGLLALAQAEPGGFTPAQAATFGAAWADVLHWVNAGYLVPIWEDA